MSNGPRFFAPPENWDCERGSVALDPHETRHCQTVMRCQAGHRVVVFDGRGCQAQAAIPETQTRKASEVRGPAGAASRADLELRIECLMPIEPRPPLLMLATAIPKGKLMEWIIEKSVELGVSEITPLLTERTIVRIGPGERVHRQQKWQRLAIEACKQCGQNWLPEVHEPATSENFFLLTSTAAFDLPLIASLESGAAPLRKIVDAFRDTQSHLPRTAALVVGPEGDLTADEYAFARDRGWRALTLGALTLRVETAALFGISILRHELSHSDCSGGFQTSGP
ncbi:MAG: RsmE family RNA methyltransferase [Verrucomicrobiales bacterium]